MTIFRNNRSDYFGSKLDVFNTSNRRSRSENFFFDACFINRQIDFVDVIIGVFWKYEMATTNKQDVTRLITTIYHISWNKITLQQINEISYVNNYQHETAVMS